VRVVVTGAGGQVGREVVEALGSRAIALTRADLDVSSLSAVRAMVAAQRPDAIIDCAAWTDVDGCEGDPERAMRVNGLGPSNLVRGAPDAHVVVISTDYVFDGTKPSPYVESDTPNPVSVYGRSKRAGEKALDLERCTVVRTSLVCGRYGTNLVKTILRLLAGDAALRFVADQRSHPTIVHDLASALVRVVDERRTGVWHVTNQGVVTPYEFARTVAEVAGYDPARVEPAATPDLPPRPAPRPANAVLDTERWPRADQLPDFRDSLPALIAHLTRRV
jgi:dTDP-4-dehydrorhamnose reductase